MKKVIFTLLMILIAINVRQSNAKPVLSRIKRVSDQRLAELETLIALDKLKGKLITVPVGMGVDPGKIGRKRRDETFLQNLFNASDEDIADENDAILMTAEIEAEAEAETELKSALLQRLQRLQHAQHLQQLRRRFADIMDESSKHQQPTLHSRNLIEPKFNFVKKR